jgi:hypothetical protein
MDVELLPQTPDQAQVATLAFMGIVGGGLIAYEASRAIQDGDLFKTDPTPEKAEIGVVAGIVGITMMGFMYQEAAKEVGWKPIIWGSLGVFAVAATVSVLRR